MLFTCTRENLSQALDLVSALAGKQTSLPILQNILIEVTDSQVWFSSTNLESAVKTSIRARVEETGSFTVPAKTLSDYVRLLGEDQVELKLEGTELLVSCGTSKTKIKGSSPEEFPVIPGIDEENAQAYAIDAGEFKVGLGKVVIAVAKNEIRPELSGVFFNMFSERFVGLLMAATDSYRLAESQVKVAQGDLQISCIVPSRVCYEIIRLLGSAKGGENESNVRLWLSENQIAVRYGSFELTARLVDGRYPDYTQIIPANFKTHAIFPVSNMVKQIKAASLFTTVGVNAVNFGVETEKKVVTVQSTSTQTGEHSSELEADVDGEKNSILLNHRYVLDGLNQMDSDQVNLGVNSGDAPCLLKPDGESSNYLYIVMPIRQ